MKYKHTVCSWVVQFIQINIRIYIFFSFPFSLPFFEVFRVILSCDSSALFTINWNAQFKIFNRKTKWKLCPLINVYDIFSIISNLIYFSIEKVFLLYRLQNINSSCYTFSRMNALLVSIFYHIISFFKRLIWCRLAFIYLFIHKWMHLK